jgi:S-adenosylmethionine synthetase
MFGYACDDTKELMPLPIWLAHELAAQLAKVRKSGALPYLRPDGKTQVTIEYEGDKAVALNTVVISSQHAEEVSVEKQLTPEIIEQVINPIIAKIDLPKNDLRILINPTGWWSFQRKRSFESR